MSLFLDARVPVRFAPADQAGPEQAGPDAAWLVQDDTAAPAGVPVAKFALPAAMHGHPAACACCVPRGPVADALSRLFLARARGDVGFFRSVIACPRDAAGAAAIRAALASDPVLRARFRLAD